MRRKQKAVTDWNRTPIIRERDGVREAIDAAWGLVPMWWSKPLAEKSFDTFNAKVERVREAKSFKHTLKNRCLVPAKCFYESTGPKGGKLRHECGLVDGGPVLLMGLWDYNRMHDLLSFTVLTTEPGDHFRRFHHRVAAVAPDADTIDAYFGGSVDLAVDLARRSNGDQLAVNPPEPLAAIV